MSDKFDKVHAQFQEYQKKVADLRAENQELSLLLENSGGKYLAGARSKVLQSGVADQEYKVMKYEDWRCKMMCMTCKQNENDTILSCGHLSCSKCIDDTFASRQRVCPVDRRKITKNDVIKIFWNEE
jgi:hypothetical protein